jgi:hypothetical protein
MTRTEILMEALEAEIDFALTPETPYLKLIGHLHAARTIAFNLKDDLTGKFGIKPRHTLIAEPNTEETLDESI